MNITMTKTNDISFKYENLKGKFNFRVAAFIQNGEKLLLQKSDKDSFYGLIGGFTGDAGLTGRKIVVDSYQGFAPVGGGAFSGKDPSKVDRSGAYMARVIAKDILKNNDNLEYVLVQLSYAIGLKNPLAIYITSDKGDLKVPDDLYEKCSVQNIINSLDLLNEKYEKRAMFGHFID